MTDDRTDHSKCDRGAGAEGKDITGRDRKEEGVKREPKEQCSLRIGFNQMRRVMVSVEVSSVLESAVRLWRVSDVQSGHVRSRPLRRCASLPCGANEKRLGQRVEVEHLARPAPPESSVI